MKTTLLSIGVVACLSEPGGDVVNTGGAGSGATDPVGGSSGNLGTGGATTGGTTSSGGAGGSVANGGALPTGGTAGSGVTGGTGGSDAAGTGGAMITGGTGGMDAMGMGGMAGDGGGRGGRGGGGNAGGMGGTAGAAAGMGGKGGSGGGGSGTCTKGQTKGNQVAMIGESFIAATHQITQTVESQAKAAGSLAQNERYIDNSVSGTTLANNQIGSQYDKAVQSSGNIKYVLMDGGGNDCLINNNGNAALTAATQLFQRMAQNNTEKVVYFFYPDPIGNNFASLKSCLDALRPQMKAICDGLTSPKCYWLDLREVWNGHNEYTADGIHPTAAGSQATGEAIWEVMVENCVAQ
jgi:lysophospholipase L1-like esterase